MKIKKKKVAARAGAVLAVILAADFVVYLRKREP
jgi:hypothetical protein